MQDGLRRSCSIRGDYGQRNVLYAEKAFKDDFKLAVLPSYGSVDPTATSLGGAELVSYALLWSHSLALCPAILHKSGKLVLCFREGKELAASAGVLAHQTRILTLQLL